MIVFRQEHNVVSEVAALGTKSGWALYRKHLHAFVGIPLPSGCWTLSCSAAVTLRRGGRRRAAFCVCQRQHQAERPYAQVHQPLCYGQGCFNSGSAGGLFWHLYNEYICSGGSGSVALLFLDRNIKNQSRSQRDEAQLFDSH